MRTQADPVLLERLSREDAAEQAGLSPHERTTCRVHRRWLYECVASPLHAIAVTGHRWCRGCETAANVSVDELAGSIALTCPRCGLFPDSAANRQIIRACRASRAAALRRAERSAVARQPGRLCTSAA